MSERPYDIILYGATGFTGKLTAEYLVSQIDQHTPPLKIAFAGRNINKLKALTTELNADDKVELIACPGDDTTQIEKMTMLTTTLIQLAGPYSLYGTPFIKSCVKTGTHYCDLTGEPFWIRDRSLELDEEARSKKLKIVNACGFDSIPSDISTLYWSDILYKRYGEKVQSVENTFTVSGSASGGTVASMKLFRDLPNKTKKESFDPYYLCPGISKEERVDKASLPGAPQYNADLKKHTGWFIMEAVNSRIVRKTIFLLKKNKKEAAEMFSDKFSYKENQSTGGYLVTLLLTFALLFFFFLFNMPIISGLIDKLLPAPGDGPSAEKRRKSFFKTTTVAKSENHKVIGEISGGDPGYTETAHMIVECAVALSRSSKDDPQVYGVITPGLAFGPSFVERLKYAGIKVNQKELC